MALFANIKKHGVGKLKRKGEFLHGLTSITASLSIENTEEYDCAFTEQGELHGLTSIAADLSITEATQKDFNIKDNEALKIFMSAIISIQEV